VSEQLEQAQGLPASGDVPGLLRFLRAGGGELPLGEVARLVAGAAQAAGFDDLAQAAAAVADGDGPGAQDAQALYGFGFACLERGAGYLAIRPLERALELAPHAAPVLSELVTALESDGQPAPSPCCGSPGPGPAAPARCRLRQRRRPRAGRQPVF
jgi:hypothetical protein